MNRLALLTLLVIPACRDARTIASPFVQPPVPTRLLVALSTLTNDGAAGSAVQDPPTVLVTDVSGGAGIPGVAVRFAVATGAGYVGDTLVLTDVRGVARCAQWVLGPTEGQNTLLARVNGADSLVFSAKARIATTTVATYELQKVGDDSLPITLGTFGDTTYLLTGGSYALSRDGSFSWGYQTTARAGAYSRVEFTPVTGTYQYFQADATIRFIRNGERFSTGTVRGSVFTVRYVDIFDFADEVYVLSQAPTQSGMTRHDDTVRVELKVR
jgi:hypothetical protein